MATHCHGVTSSSCALKSIICVLLPAHSVVSHCPFLVCYQLSHFLILYQVYHDFQVSFFYFKSPAAHHFKCGIYQCGCKFCFPMWTSTVTFQSHITPGLVIGHTALLGFLFAAPLVLGFWMVVGRLLPVEGALVPTGTLTYAGCSAGGTTN